MRALLFTFLLCSAAVLAKDLSCRTDSFGTTRCDNGTEYRTDSFGTTRDNRGNSWRTDSIGTQVFYTCPRGFNSYPWGQDMLGCPSLGDDRPLKP